jgi:hypothetical protein
MDQSYLERLAALPLYPVWSALPKLHDSIDPFDFNQRLAVYKLLMEVTNRNGAFGPDNEFNLFWGYSFQVHWQWYSGRLRLAHTPPERIDPNSVWGYGNYSLSIVPLVAAMQAGIVPKLEIQPPYTESTFEYISGGRGDNAFQIPTVFVEAVGAWKAFFERIEATTPGSDLEPLRFELWKVHHRSLLAAEHALNQIGPQYCPRSELDFLTGWTRMVDFLGTAAWRTDLLFMLENGLGVLPGRMLTDKDIPGDIADMDKEVNSNIKSIIGLTRQPKLRFNFNLWLWKRAMRTREARDDVWAMLGATFNPSPQNVSERRKLLRYIIAP